MGGSKATKVEKPDPTPTMQEQYTSWLKSYPNLQPMLQYAATTDLKALEKLYGGAASSALSTAITESGELQDQYSVASEGKTAADMRQLLADQIYGDLRAGSELTADQAREIEQYVRSAQVGRGITGGNAAIFEEAMTKGSAGIDLANSRRAAAQDFLSFNAATKPKALSMLLGIADNAYTGNAEIMQGAVAQNNAAAMQDQQIAYNVNATNAMNRANANRGLGTTIGTLGGAGVGYMVGGPMGAVVGGSLGGAAGGGIGGMF